MTNKNLYKILFVEDLPSDSELAVLELRKEGQRFKHMRVDTRDEFIKALNEFRPDIVISDYMMPSYTGMQALLDAREFDPLMPFILYTGSMNEETAVDCIKAGATDYIIKEHMTRLPFAVKEALEQVIIQKEKRASELLLKENEEKLQSIFSVAPIGIGLVVNRVIMEVNNTFCNITGYTRKELIGKSSELIYASKEEYDSDGTEKYRQISDKGIGSVETRFKCKNGKILNILLSSAPLDIADLTKGVTFTAMDITEKKRVEEALHESEERFRILYNDAVVGLYRTNLHGEIFLANTTLVKMLGFQSFGELAARNLTEAGYGPSYKRQQFVDQIEKEGEVKDLEAIWICKDGKEIFVRESAKAIYDSDGKILYYDGTVEDITDRKKAEKALRESEEIFRHFMMHSPIYVFFKDENIRAIRLSNNYEAMLGKPMAELLGKNMDELFPSAFAKSIVEDDIRVLKERNVITVEEELNGRFYTTIKFPIIIDGRPTYLAGYTIDITDRKLADEALKQSYAFSESLLKTIPFGMDIVDEEGTILFQSDNFKRLFGEAAIGTKCWELYRDDKKQCKDCPLLHGINVGVTEAYESDGVLGERIFEIIHTGMIYQGKKAMLEIFQDITDRKENEAELIAAKEKAEESDRLKTAFLHNISHEIRTPMNAIVGFSALLGESELDKVTQKSYIETIMQSSNHLLAIISDIVDISNIEANLVKTSKNAININSLLESLYNQFQIKAVEKGIILACESNLGDSEALISGDSTKLTQIISNLLNNALKFTDEGSIIVSLKKAGRLIQFSVSDTGIGIPGDFQDRIFERFYQLQNTTSRIYEGTGLGLAISKAYVELMGGKIWVSSEPGKGTTFTFTIPYQKQIIAEKPSVERAVTETFRFKRKMKILVAEDIDSNFMLLTYFLKGTNAEIIRAVNGRVALEKCLAEKDIDLVLMDIKMPGMDGYTAVKLIREAKITIPIIAQTAYADDKARALEVGCNGFLSKPFDKYKLLNAVKEHIEII
jgi:PAS domain S-box-containing protein